MKRTRSILAYLLLAAGLAWSSGGGTGPAAPASIRETPAPSGLQVRFFFAEAVGQVPLDGRIILGFHKDVSKPINNPDLFNPQPTFAWDVRGGKPGEAILLDGSNAESWKGDLDALDGWYGVQAVFKTRKARSVNSPGNVATAKTVVLVEKGKMCRPIDLLFSISAKAPRPFKETEFIKEMNLPSDLLARFFGEPEPIRAAVILPPSYFKEPGRRYPSVYVMGGWGSSHLDVLEAEASQQKRYGMSGFGGEKVFVFLNLACRNGFQTFCDSDANGPREETFFRELVPYVEKTYRVDTDPRTRFLAGQSTGAWASLWLLIRHPDQFGGAYAGSPDPVDFTEFLGTNIYDKGADMYRAAGGGARVFAPKGPFSTVSIEDFTGLDRIAGWGEQMSSFDAAFSPKGANGEPRRLYDWKTGRVDPEVAAAWAEHDLSRLVSKLDRRTKALLRDKIRVFVASGDPFGLNKPVEAFERALAAKGLRAHILYVPGDEHSSWNDEIRRFMHEDMDRKCGEAGTKTPS